MLKRVCVYSASSSECAAEYHAAASQLGRLLATAGYAIVYGGGAIGSMGALADGALAAGGEVVGIIPQFMAELEGAHTRLSELRVVENMRIRKHLMLADSDAVVALPGGTGTLEELLEAITLKRLGIYLNPIILVNTRNFFDPLLLLLQQCVAERFIDQRHTQMWSVVSTPEEVLTAIATAPTWSATARSFATR